MSGDTPKISPRIITKLLTVLAILAVYVLVSKLGSLFFSKAKVRGYRVRTMRRAALVTLICLGVRVRRPSFHWPDSNTLILSNHVSYLDVLVLLAVRPAVFVTSIEVRDSFFLGTLCRAGGCLFVERRNLKSLHQEVVELGKVLDEGWNVALFPEGTTSSGEGLLPFRNSLLDSAIHAQVPIVPVYLKYHQADGKAFDGKSRDRVCYYGDHDFFPHLVGLLGLRSIDAEVTPLEPISPSKSSRRRELADQARKEILQVFTPIVREG